jgi:hypothetical protein
LHDAKTNQERILKETKLETEKIEQESRERLEKELSGKRERVELQLKQDREKWEHDLDTYKQRETESMNLWLAEERKKVQSKLTGDLDVFVGSVTSAALAQVQQNPQLAPIVNQIHSKIAEDLKVALTTEGTFVAQFNPNRKQDTRAFWMKAAAAVLMATLGGIVVQWAPEVIQKAVQERRADRSGGAAGEWMRKMAAERAERMALKLEVREGFQDTYLDNVLYNEGYLEMKLDTELQSAWIKELNAKMTGERALGLSEEAIVDFIRIEHSLFMDLQQKKKQMHALNKDELIPQMRELSQKAKADLIQVLKAKVLTGSDRARQTSPEQKYEQLRELEKSFYTSIMASSTSQERKPATPESDPGTR